MTANQANPVLAKLAGLLPKLEELYTDLHAHPELSMRETRTAGIVAQRLCAAGYEVTTWRAWRSSSGRRSSPTFRRSPPRSSAVPYVFALRYMAISHGWHLPRTSSVAGPAKEVRMPADRRVDRRH